MSDCSGAGVGGFSFCYEWSFKRTSKSLFGNTDWLSFFVVVVAIICVYVESFECVEVWSFLWCLNICFVLWIVPNGWLCSMRCCANFDAWLLVLNACLCSLNLIENFSASLAHIHFVAYWACEFVYF